MLAYASVFVRVIKQVNMRLTSIAFLISIGLVSSSSASDGLSSLNDCASLADTFVNQFDHTVQLAEKTANYLNENHMGSTTSSGANDQPANLDEIFDTIHALKNRPKDKLRVEIKRTCTGDGGDSGDNISARQNNPESQMTEMLHHLIDNLIDRL